jgi:hypothetical protein
MRFGMISKLAQRGINPLTKTAETDLFTLDGISKGVITLAIATGIPLGALWHHFSRQTMHGRRKEDELKRKLEYYRNATDTMQSGLTA